jgi:predicted flap endonuclease-1-like 5' DNA nuclease
MTSLFFDTFIIQLFVGMLFLMLGIWAGRYLFAKWDLPQPAEASTQSPAVSAENAGDAAKAKEELRQLRTLNERLEKELRALKVGAEKSAPTTKIETPAAVPVEAEAEVKTTGDAKTDDDLLAIRGIGKVMAETLTDSGITNYRQIAGWTKTEIDALPFKSRIARDKWQSQAKRLHKEKYGEKI